MNDAPPTKPARQLSRPVVIVLGVVVASVCVVLGFAIGASIMLVNAGVLNPAWTEANIQRTQHRAAQIIAALEAYHDTHHVYPESLDALLQAHLDTIPQPTAGVDHWYYASTEGGSGFVLQFSANQFDNPTAWFESRHNRWFLQDGELLPPQNETP